MDSIPGFWGKYDQVRKRWLPLTSHSLDVALLFRELVRLKGFRRALEASAGRQLTERDLDRLAVLALYHDLGKANFGFQRKILDPRFRDAGHTRELEPLFSEPDLEEKLAQALSYETLLSWGSPETISSLLLASWSHHGRPLKFKGARTGTLAVAAQWWRSREGFDPFRAIEELHRWAEKVFPGAFERGGEPLPEQPDFHHRFAGLVILADWLGSHPSYFPIEPVPPEERLSRDLEVIPKLLARVGLEPEELQGRVQAPAPGTVRRRLLRGSFQELFGFSARPVQALIEALSAEDPANRLLILEAETGSGKTEAALLWFHKLFQAGKVSGLYFALPTRVAARELYERVRRIVARWFPDPDERPPTLLAVPGYAQIDGVPPSQILPSEEEANRWRDEEDPRTRLWAAEHPKRFLVAPIAVGTIDQALLGIVQVPHAHLRAASLQKSLLVVDEVHASDHYMTVLLQELLDFHRKGGGYAMLLSATLGARARSRFLKKPCPDFEQAVREAFPALTTVTGRALPAPSHRPSKRVSFELKPWAFSPERLLPVLQDALSKGARVLVVLNTVKRACSFLRVFERQLPHEGFFQCAGLIAPHHGRFAPEDRLLLDREVSRQFGREAPAGARLLIGTQTLEQSLDLDADLLVTDLCPCDVLLQRVGRLHRHDRPRPPGFEKPRVLVLLPEVEDFETMLDNRGEVVDRFRELGYGSVYEDLRVLELSRRLLEARGTLEMPRDNRLAVETVTHPDQLAQLRGERWQRHGQKIEGEALAHKLAASGILMPVDQRFGEFAFHDASAQVATRLGIDTYSLPLDRPAKSPFGQTIETLNVPAWLLPERFPELGDRLEVLASLPEGLKLKLGGNFLYSRFGLEPDEPSP